MVNWFRDTASNRSLHTLSMRNHHLILCLLCFRLFNAFTLQTFFQPDEYYQSLEPAHHLVFGYGFLTWEYQTGIRSIAHALLFAGPFYLLKILNLDSPRNVLYAPKVIGAIQAALGDYYTAKFISKYWSTGSWSILVPILSPWNWFVATRTFSNSLETSITAYALYKWPFESVPLTTDALFSDYLITTIKSMASIGFAFVIRPTTSLIWIVPSIRQIVLHKTTFIFEAFFVLYVTLQYSAIIDSFYYGSITFPLLNFFRFNASGAASFYGINNWHYYATQGIPLLLTGFLPFTIHGLLEEHRLRQELTSMIGLVLLAYSLIAHKEVRFIMPLLPILHAFTASSIHKVWKKSKLPVLAMLILNVCIAYYASQVHQSGVISLINHIQTHPEINNLVLLMPCHSTPWQSHIHRPGNFRFLTCNPPPDIDEADQFYDSPKSFLKSIDCDYIATFEASQAVLEQSLAEQGVTYNIERRWFNSHVHDDARRQGDVLLYALHKRRRTAVRQEYQAFS